MARDYVGRDARLESFKVFGESVLALDQGDPRASDLGILATILGISREDRCRGHLDVLRGEQLREPLVDVCEQAVFADGQAWWMILEGRRLSSELTRAALERVRARRSR